LLGHTGAATCEGIQMKADRPFRQVQTGCKPKVDSCLMFSWPGTVKLHHEGAPWHYNGQKRNRTTQNIERY